MHDHSPPLPSATDKRQTLLYLLKKHAVKHFVETGTYRGGTVDALKNHVESVNTIELDEKLFLFSHQRFANQKHIKCWHGSSGNLLATALKQCAGPALIWLDGHFSGGDTARGDEVSPILKEILHVAACHEVSKHVILIDDVRLFDGKDYPLLRDTLELISRHLPNHRTEVYRDMIFVEPACDWNMISDDALLLGYRFAPRKLISTNSSYLLFLGHNFDREAAWRAGYQDSDCVSSVLINHACRFGNSIQQWKNAVGVALNHGLRRIYTPGYWWMKSGIFTLDNGLEVVNQANTVMSDEEVILSGQFYDIKHLCTFSSAQLTHAAAIQLLGENVRIKPDGEALPENHLVIHIRAGDIFTSKRVHPRYGQPPLAFYINVLECGQWNHVTLIAENDANPVWQPLLDYCQERYTCDFRVGKKLEDDIGFLLRAQSIVIARGTFASGLSCLMHHWKKVITFESPLVDWGIDHIKVETWVDAHDDYRNQLLSANWANTPAQRQMMLRYPTAKISIMV